MIVRFLFSHAIDFYLWTPNNKSDIYEIKHYSIITVVDKCVCVRVSERKKTEREREIAE